MRKLDGYDLAILRTLQSKGRITKTALAEAVNLSPSPCWERLRRLEDDGYISGYSADIDIRLLGPITEVLVEVTLANHRSSDFKRFECFVQDVEEITECVATGGGIDYMLRLVVRDVDAYQQLMDRLLETDVGIDRYFGYIVTKRVKAAHPSIDAIAEAP